MLHLDRFSKTFFAVSAAAVIVFVLYFAQSASPRDGDRLSRRWREPQAPSGGPTPRAPCRFVDVTEACGIHFVHSSGERVRDIRDVVGAGVAIEDLDLDGDQDVFLVNGGGPTAEGIGHHELYLNQGDFTFTLAPRSAGVSDAQQGMGCVVGDVSGDGWPDLIVTGLNENKLYLHQGLDRDGQPTFRNVAQAAGIGETGFATAAALNDLDGDGDLDLVIVRYLTYHEPTTTAERIDERNEPHEFVPRNFPAEPDLLFLNQGTREDGTPRFELVADAEVSKPLDKGLGVLFTDLDLDLRPDLYVANDVSPNRLFVNRGGRLVAASAAAGDLVDDERSGMGLTIGDVDGNGRPDILATYWQDEPNALYRNEPSQVALPDEMQAFFTDLAPAFGLAAPSYGNVGWGTCLVDFDLDAVLDALIVNGYTSPPLDDSERSACVPQKPLLFFGEPRASAPFFRVAGKECGSLVDAPLNARGAAAGDLDNDGDVDLVITQNQGPALVLRNDTQPGREWLKIKLVPLTGTNAERRSPPHGIGAQLTATVGTRTLCRWVLAGDSYLSHSSFEIELGLGEAREVDGIEVRWPSGRLSRVGRTPARQLLVIRETP